MAGDGTREGRGNGQGGAARTAGVRKGRHGGRGRGYRDLPALSGQRTAGQRRRQGMAGRAGPAVFSSVFISICLLIYLHLLLGLRKLTGEAGGLRGRGEDLERGGEWMEGQGPHTLKNTCKSI